MLVCANCTLFGTRDRGCSVHPAFPAPSVSREGQRDAKLGRKLRRENAKARPLSRAVVRGFRHRLVPCRTNDGGRKRCAASDKISFCLNAFSSREPVSTSLENALVFVL